MEDVLQKIWGLISVEIKFYENLGSDYGDIVDELEQAKQHMTIAIGYVKAEKEKLD